MFGAPLGRRGACAAFELLQVATLRVRAERAEVRVRVMRGESGGGDATRGRRQPAIHLCFFFCLFLDLLARIRFGIRWSKA